MKNFSKIYPALILFMTAMAFLADLSFAQSRPRPHPRPPSYGGGGGIVVEPPNPYDPDDRMAYDIIRQSASRLDCNGLARMLDDVSARIHYAAMLGDAPLPPGGRDPESIRRRIAQRVRERLRSPGFTRAMWARVTTAYRGCGFSCFDNGQAVGLISGSGYCMVANAIGAAPSDQLWPAPAMNACDHLGRSGCETGYRQAAASVPGCQYYSTGYNTAAFLSAMDQDCAPF